MDKHLADILQPQADILDMSVKKYYAHNSCNDAITVQL